VPSILPSMSRPRHRALRCSAILLASVLVGSCAAADPSGSPTATSATGPTESTRPVASESPLASPSPTDKPESTVARARWADCGGGFTCAEVRVPRDYDAPSEGYLNIAMIRWAASGPEKPIGSLFINPGGPGASGVDFVRDGLALFSDEIRQRFDIIGFDPRGVNSSTAIRCIDNLDGHAALDPSPDDAAELTELVDAAEAYAKACARRNEATLAYLSTDAVARDLDLLRASVGDEALTYLGFSYGTLIGSRYAELFPDRIRAMALDGGVDPSLDLGTFRADQARAFEGALQRFLDDCASRTRCDFHEGGDSARAFDRLMTAIDRKPIPAPLLDDGRLVGPGLAWTAVLAALYSESFWPILATALADAKDGDGSLMLVISDPYRGRKSNGSYSNLQDAYVGNTCLDFPAPSDVDVFTGWAADLEATAPHFAEFVAYNDLICAFWAVPPQGMPHAVTAEGAPPIVVVGTTGDPATPYAWSVSLADQLESGVLITREGEGHTGYGDSLCVQDAVDEYLLELTVPEDGHTC
jgi:pimeloyl-ACP methyl ester carboxylesterase